MLYFVEFFNRKVPQRKVYFDFAITPNAMPDHTRYYHYHHYHYHYHNYM